MNTESKETERKKENVDNVKGGQCFMKARKQIQVMQRFGMNVCLVRMMATDGHDRHKNEDGGREYVFIPRQ